MTPDDEIRIDGPCTIDRGYLPLVAGEEREYRLVIYENVEPSPLARRVGRLLRRLGVRTRLGQDRPGRLLGRSDERGVFDPPVSIPGGNYLAGEETR